MFRLMKLLLILAVLGAAAFFVERLIETDAEAVEAVVEEGARAVREGDFPGLRALLTEAYRGEGKTADGAVKRVKSLWQAFRPGSIRADVLEVQVDGDRATAPVNARLQIAGRPITVALDVGFVREAGEGWKIASAVPKDVAGLNLPSFLR